MSIFSSIRKTLKGISFRNTSILKHLMYLQQQAILQKKKEASASTLPNNFRLNLINYQTKTRLKSEYIQDDYVANIKNSRVGTNFENSVLRNLLRVTPDVNTKHKNPP